jgi:methyl-accepting chemotaxis protein
MKDLKIGTKLWLLVGVLLAIMVGMALFASIAAERERATTEQNLAQTHDLIAAVEAARSAQVNFKIQVQEWKNVLLRGSDKALYDKHLTAFGKQEAQTQRDLERLRTLGTRIQLDKSKIDAVAQAHANLGPKYRAALAESDPASPNFAKTVDGKVRGIDRAPTEAIDTIVADVQAQAEKTERGQLDEAAVHAQTARSVNLAGGLAAIALALGLSVVFIRAVTLPLSCALDTVRGITEGRLDRDIEPGGRDEVGQLLSALRAMQGKLRETISEVSQGAQRVKEAASEMASASTQIDAGARTQSEATSSTAAAIEEVTVSIGQVAECAQEAATVAERSSELAKDGEAIVRQASSEMNSIAVSVQESSQLVETLSKRSGEISTIVKVIKDIADQTNLLALNAAIEAARAGEQGRGFAVVADEVRKLAERTGTATFEIGTMIEAIQQETSSVVSTMRAGGDKVRAGVELADKAAEALERINAQTQESLTGVTAIASAVREQQSASTDIAKNVERIAQMAEEASATATQTAGAAQSLTDLALSLDRSLGRFKV